MFLNDEGKIFNIPNFKESNTFLKLNAGVYNLKFQTQGMNKVPYFEQTDKYTKGVNIDIGVFKDINDYIEMFLSPEMRKAREEMNMMHKLGLLLHGAPGTGKTFLCGQIAESLAKKYNAISIITTEFTQFDVMVDVLRTNDDPNRLVLIVIDEFEKGVRRVDTSEILSFLDGTTSKDNVIVLATVNDMSELRSYYTERPGRFEGIFEFDMSKEEVTKAIVNSLTPSSFIDKLDTTQIIKNVCKGNTKDKTIDNIRILIRNEIAKTFTDKHSKINLLDKFKKVTKTKIGFKPHDETKKTDLTSEEYEEMDLEIERFSNEFKILEEQLN